MIDKVKQLFRRSWFSCERFSERASCKMDSPLSLRDEMGFRFHFLICHTCRHVAKHWERMQGQLKSFSEEFSESESTKLSQTKAKEICEQLEKTKH